VCSVTCGKGTTKRSRRCTGGGSGYGYGYASKPAVERRECTGSIPVCCTWSDWSPWEPCDKSCDGGRKRRSRFPSNYAGGCVGDKQDTATCNEQPCPRWAPWAKWSLCSVSCGGGTQSRTRSCHPANGACDGAPNEESSCNEKACPEWNPWGSWGSCSASCAGGTQSRTRTCSAKGLCPGKGQESQECGSYGCPQFGPWGKWDVCTNPCGGGQRVRDRQCITDTAYCTAGKVGKDPVCTCGDMVLSDSGACNKHKCAEWGQWTPWGSCSADCGGGTKTRERKCDNDPAFCGTHPSDVSCQCSGVSSQETECGNRKCAAWTKWQEWTSCSASCGGGERERLRTCQNDKAFCTGANANKDACKCAGDGTGNEKCNTHKCPKWKPFGSWSKCTQNCGGGEKTKTRTCDRDESYCTGKSTDDSCVCQATEVEGELVSASLTAACNEQTCATWSEWSNWGACSVTCGPGNQDRTRTCETDASFCASNPSHVACQCKGKKKETKDCNLGKCPKWGPWQEWGACSVSCGVGQETRTRKCSRTDAPCVGDSKGDTDTKDCDKGICPQWTPWTTWSECTVLCGGGSRTRARTCPIVDGCAGLNEESGICSNVPCPDWGNWAPWSDCSKTCGGGERTRTRTCAIEKACKPGVPFQRDPVTCNPQKCPLWAQWGEWSQCSATCGTGQRVRKRSCTPPEGCLGRKEDFEECREQLCIFSTFWSAWSPCTKTCGGGVQFRSRASCPEGPPKCNVEKTEQTCNKAECPQWSDWEQWSACSRPCGKGQRVRTRRCPVVNGCTGQGRQIDPKPCNDVPCLDAPLHPAEYANVGPRNASEHS
jgi:hypothetical protein